MGTSYSGKKIKNTFGSIIKVSDNSNLTAFEKQLSDGLGNDIGLFVGTNSRLGIGITPTEALHVSGNFNLTGEISSTGNRILLTNSSDPELFLRKSVGGDSIKIKVNGSTQAGNNALDSKVDFDFLHDNVRIFGYNGSTLKSFVNIDAQANSIITTGVVSFGSLTDSGESIMITKFVDAADSIASNNNDTTIPTSAAVKSYVDTNLTAQDLDFSDGSSASSVDLDSQTFVISGTSNEIETSASGQTLTIGLPNDVTISGNLSFGGLTDSGESITVTKFVDEADGISNNDNDTTVPTSAAVKDFVDSQITAEDLDFSDGSTAGSVDLNSQTFVIQGTANEVETSASSQTLTIGLPNSVSIASTLGVGVTATRTLSVSNRLNIVSANDANANLLFGDTDDDSIGQIKYNNATNTMELQVNNSVAQTINSSGNTTFTGQISSIKELINVNSANGTRSGGFEVQDDGDLFIGTATTAGNIVFETGNTTNGLPSTGTARLTLNSTSATFSGSISATGSTLSGVLDVTATVSDAVFLRSSQATTTNVYITNTNATANNTANLYFAPANNIGGAYIRSTAIEDFSSSANRTADLRFAVRKDGTFSDALIIDSAGNSTFAGNIALGGGTLQTYHSNVTSVLKLDDQTSIFTRSDELYLANNFFYNSSDAGTAIETGKSSLLLLERDELKLFFAASASAGASASLAQKFGIDDTGKIQAQTSGGYFLTENTTDSFSIKSNGANGTLTIRDEFNSADRLTISNAGATNISGTLATASAGNTLTVSSTSGSAAIIDIGRTADTTAKIKSGDTAAGDLTFFTGGSRRLTIDSDGRVMINQTSNITGQSLQVNGFIDITKSSSHAIRFFDNTTFRGGLGLDSWATGGSASNITMFCEGEFGIVTGGGSTKKLVMDSSGNLGIGVVPVAKLHVSGDTGGTDSIARFQNTNSAKVTRIQLSDNAGTVGDVLIAYDHSDASSANHFLGMGVNNSTTLVINNNDNVGINTTTPARPLSVNSSQISARFTSSSADSQIEIADSSGTVVFGSSSGNAIIQAGSAERFRIKSSGNFGIGTDTPNQVGYSVDTRVVSVKAPNSGGAAVLELNGKGNSDNNMVGSVQFLSQNDTTPLAGIKGLRHTSDSSGKLSFETSAVERMRILEDGRFCVNQTAGDSDTDGFVVFPTGSSNGTMTNCYNGDDGTALRVGRNSDGTLIEFVRGTSTVGSVSVTSSGTSFNATSDYRIKEDLKDFSGLDKVSKIDVYDFKYKNNNDRGYGVIAHELQEVYPQAVHGEKDAEQMQGVDYSKIVPLLVKSIQELKKEIEILKNK